jgi:hypothetical protein
MFKRILLTALLGGGLLFTLIPGAADASHRGDGDRDRRGYWNDRVPVYYGAPGLLHFTGLDRAPDLYLVPGGSGAGYAGYRDYGRGYGQGYGGGYGYGARLTDVIGDDYYFTYGYRCNGYRNGYYVGDDGAPISYYGRPYWRHNSDCDDFYARHGYWYGDSFCSRYDAESGYCDEDD